jgi:hypothetical protein
MTKLYVLLGNGDGRADEFLGVYSSLEELKEAAKQVSWADFTYQGFLYQERELNGKPDCGLPFLKSSQKKLKLN